MNLNITIPLTAGVASLLANVGGWFVSGNQSLQQVRNDVQMLRKDIEWQARLNNQRFASVEQKMKGNKTCELQ